MHVCINYLVSNVARKMRPPRFFVQIYDPPRNNQTPPSELLNSECLSALILLSAPCEMEGPLIFFRKTTIFRAVKHIKRYTLKNMPEILFKYILTGYDYCAWYSSIYMSAHD